MPNVHYLNTLCWPDVDGLLRQGEPVAPLLAIGSTEQHGPHLPLGTDAFIVTEYAERLAKKIAERCPVLLLPPMPYGVSAHHLAFAGSLSLPAPVLVDIVVAVAASLRHHGLPKLILLNGHGGNVIPLKWAARRLKDETGQSPLLINYWTLVPDVVMETMTSQPLGHACEMETSLMFVTKPDLVRTDRFGAPQLKPSPITTVAINSPYLVPTVDLELNFDETTVNGAFGDPRPATREKGLRVLEESASRGARAVWEYLGTGAAG